MQIDEKKLRQMIKLEMKMTLAESTIAQGLENVAGEAQRVEQEVDDQSDMAFEWVMNSDRIWNANEAALNVAAEVAAQLLNVPSDQMKRYTEQGEIESEMDLHLELVGLVTNLALEYAKKFKLQNQGGM